MRIFGYFVAILAGCASWGLTLAFSGGVAPLGRAGPTEGAVFFTPILLFAGPIALFSLVRGNSLRGLWIGALAPILGAANFALSMSFVVYDSNASGPIDDRPPTFALAWCALLLLVLAAFVVSQRQQKKQGKP